MPLSKWWKTSPVSRPDPVLPKDRRIYAIGDIHGRSDLLDTMAKLVAHDLRQRPVPAATTVFLGDYVDRGPDSRGVIERLVQRDFPTPIVPLRGNHEDLLIGFLCGEVDAAYHEQLGGGATLQSYGIDLAEFAWAGVEQRAAMLRAAFSDEHCIFLDNLQLSAVAGDYFFCHAGARPGVPLDKQSAEDLMWIRDDFLRSNYDFGKVIVHGHTPVREPLVRPNGIDIDTQAVSSGVLTAVVLEGSEMRFLRTG